MVKHPFLNQTLPALPYRARCSGNLHAFPCGDSCSGNLHEFPCGASCSRKFLHALSCGAICYDKPFSLIFPCGAPCFGNFHALPCRAPCSGNSNCLVEPCALVTLMHCLVELYALETPFVGLDPWI